MTDPLTAVDAARPAFSVVVPAHDEETVITRCLAFVADLLPGEAEVVVVANGCTDRTAELAGRVPGVRVLDVPAAGKAGALNAGDAAVAAFPRVYLDADITVSAAALRAVVAALARPGVEAAAPTVRFDLTGVSPGVRAFYRTYRAMPYLSEAMIGTGFYALSAAGRARFEVFPELTADDLFVQRSFAPAERAVVPGEFFTVRVPRDLRSLLAVRTRVAAGNAELAAAGAQREQPATARSTGGSLGALAGLLRREPRRAGGVGVYVAVTAISRLRARRAAATGRAGWERDLSTRPSGPGTDG